jgi:hypothetical protein
LGEQSIGRHEQEPGPFGYGKAPRSPSGLAGKRGRSRFSIAFDALFPLAIVAVAYAIGRSFFGF